MQPLPHKYVQMVECVTLFPFPKQEHDALTRPL